MKEQIVLQQFSPETVGIYHSHSKAICDRLNSSALVSEQ
jgi:hypothetical protein